MGQKIASLIITLLVMAVCFCALPSTLAYVVLGGNSSDAKANTQAVITNTLVITPTNTPAPIVKPLPTVPATSTAAWCEGGTIHSTGAFVSTCVCGLGYSFNGWSCKLGGK